MSVNLSSTNPSFSAMEFENASKDDIEAGTTTKSPKRKLMLATAALGAIAACAAAGIAGYTVGSSQAGEDLQQQIMASQGVLTGQRCEGACLTEPSGDDFLMPQVMELKLKKREQYKQEMTTFAAAARSQAGRVSCVNGKAGEFPCKNVDFMSFTSISDMGGGSSEANDIWGWTDPSNGREYAIVGMESGTGIVDVTNAENPTPLVFIRSTNGRSSPWRDVKVYADHAFIVSEASSHGMQVFDLKRVRGLTSLTTLTPDTTYSQFGSAHNIVINEETGFAYSVGTRTCSGGLHIVNIRNPTSPAYVGCFSSDGYTHDAQCVVYRGPDSQYSGREICFNYNEDTLTIVDVQDKSNIRQISRTRYNGVQYSHQGWLTEDQRYLLLDDELDETRGSEGRTKTYIWDVSSLSSPSNIRNYLSPVTSIDHNLYIKGNYAYQSNYCSGLRITDVSDVGNSMSEVAYFDVRPEDDRVEFQGTWSNYPYFASGNIIVSSIERGLFVVRPTLDGSGGTPAPTADITPAPTLEPESICDCDGGSGTYEQCVYYSQLNNNVCFVKYTGSSSTTPPDCPAEDGVEYRFSNNYGRWYKVGCKTGIL